MQRQLRTVVGDGTTPGAAHRDDVLSVLGIDTLPFRCGVDTAGFTNWLATRDASGRRTLDASLVDTDPRRLFITFCGDCDPVFRVRAEIAGTCCLADLFAGGAVSSERERAA